MSEQARRNKRSIERDPTRAMYVEWRSLDGGQTFKQTSVPLTHTDVAQEVMLVIDVGDAMVGRNETGYVARNAAVGMVWEWRRQS